MSDYFHEQMIQKMLDAKPSTWLTDGLTEKEVKECIDNAKIKCGVLRALEDVRAEIESEGKKAFGYPNWEFAKGLNKATEIIDRKIAEVTKND